MELCDNFVVTRQYSTTAGYFLPGNIIPHSWYKRFSDESNNPDLVAITILSDIVAWYRNSNLLSQYDYKHQPNFDGQSLSVPYEYFYDKFAFNKERVRRAFVRLEQHKVLTRKIYNIALSPDKRTNRLFILLTPDFFNSCFVDISTDIRAENHEIIFQSPQSCGDLIMKKNKSNIFINKNRSNISNLEKKFLKEKFERKLNVVSKIAKEKEVAKKKKQKKLADFYPLTEQEVSLLQSKSGREFNLNAMNEILQDMSKRLTDRVFGNKNSFLEYMSKVFMYEKRQAPLINNETFRIKNNLSAEEVTVREQEEYLSGIEYSLQVSPEWHLKKKLAATLEQETAYRLLKAWKNIHVCSNMAKIYLAKEVILSKREEEIILQQIKATHEKVDKQTGLVNEIVDIEIIIQEARVAGNCKEQTTIIELPDNIWGKVRKELIKQYSADIDRNWLSKLSAEICEETKQIKLLAPSEFVKDWIERNYANQLESYLKHSNYRLVIC